MKTKQLKRKIILILLIISMLVPYVPVFTPVSEAASQLPAKTGYHINYHNGGNWTNYGQSIPGCDNAIVDPNSRQCYHYLNKDVITGELYDDNGNILTKMVNTSDGGTWDVSGEYMYGHYEGSNLVGTSYEVPGYTNFKAKKDVRLYYFVSSCPDCEVQINGKYVKDLMYYKWMWNTSIYGFRDVKFSGNTGGTGYSVSYDGGTYYQYFAGYDNLAGEGLNSRGLYPSFDCAIYNRTSKGISGYDSSGNPIWNDNAVDGFVWDSHTHTVYKYKCGGHYNPNTYTVKYNANGGTGSTGDTYHTYDKDGNLAHNGFSRTGYTFGGWTDGTNTYSAGQTVKNLTATNGGVITLSAIWNRSQFNLNVNPNGGTWEGSTDSQDFTLAYEETKPISKPTRYGYSFNGWTKTGDGSTLNGTTFRMGYSNATLTAGWTLITHNIIGTVTWDDQDNKYFSRPENVTVTLSRNPTTGEVTSIPTPVQVRGNAEYAFNNVQTYDTTTGNAYTYQVSQNKVSGYKTTINTYNIINQLIVPTYSSNISYSPIDTYKNLYLKNGKVKITANIQSTSGNTYPELGLNNGIVNFQVDPDITLDTNTLKIYHTDSNSTKKQITDYTLNGNALTVDFGENKISKSKDKIEIEVYGTLNKIKEYSSSISLTGNLRAYDGENTNINLGTLTTKTAKITAQYQMPQANIKITKHDSITEQNLTNATFTLYEWNGTEYVEKETIQDTNNDGIYESKYYEWNKVTEGKYKIVETNVPENHKNLGFSMEFTINQLKAENYTITPDYSNKEYKITYNVRTPDDFDNTNGIVENEPYKIKASIDLLDSENLKQIQNEAIFKIYEWDRQTGQYKIYTSYTTGQEVKIKRQENKTYITEEWLYYTESNEGKFRIIEETAPIGYYGDYEDDQANKKRTYDINVLGIVGTNGERNETTIALSNKDGKFVNQRTKARINLNKIDSETKGEAQGDATLQGAVYEIYASENIYHADGITQNYEEETALLYKKDQLVQEKITNEDGKLTFDNLECGKYYIKEKTQSNGYLLDEKEYEIDVTYQNETIKLIEKEQTVEEKVKKQGFQIYKIKQTDRTEYEGLQDAGFTIYRINSLSIVKDGKITKNQDGTYTLNDQTAKNDEALTKLANKNGTYKIQDLVDYYYKIKYTENDMGSLPQDQNSYHPYNINEEMVKNYASSTQGSYIGELKSNGDGYIRSPELAYGEYIVIETTVPKNLETAKPFYINVQNDSRAVQKLKFITDENFETKVKIYKEDSQTGKTVLKTGAKYIIRDEEGELVTINTWDANNGYVKYGTYEHPFETGKDGYLVTPMNLKVGKYTLEEIEAPDGYVLAGYEGSSINGQITKKTQAQVTFEISTNAIYYTDDFLDTNVIVIKQQNQPQVGCLEIITEGDYVSSASKNVDGNYEFTYETRPISGTTYEIRAKENILTTDCNNTIIYEKDQLVSTVTSNDLGIAYVDNLPQGKYYIVQTIAGNGFSLNREQKEFEVKYGTNQKDLQIGTKEWKAEAQKTPVVHIEEKYKNQKQEIQIETEKIDAESGEKLKGAQIGLYVRENIVNKATNEVILEENTLVEAQTTNEEGKITFQTNLPLEQYYVKEIKAPVGYVYNGQTKEIDGSYDTSQIAIKQISTQIQNKKTSINIQKTTKEGSNLVGATLELRNSNNEVIQSWITEEQAKNIQSLKINEQYKIVETHPKEGYVTAKEITFSINDEGNIQTEAKIKDPNTIIMEDQTTKIIVELLDAKTKEQVSGATLKILNEKGEEVAKFETSDIGKEIEKLPIGKYTLVEEKIQLDKGYVTIDPVQFEIRDTEETQRVVITQEYTKLQISLKDIETKEPIVRATLQLIKKTEENEQILDEWVTMVEPHLIEKLPVGKYYIRETVTPIDRGYVTINEQEIEVKDTVQIQKVEIEQAQTKLEIELIDKETKEKIQGSKLQIIKINAEGKEEIVKEIETKEENTIIEKLPIGEYILRQTEHRIKELGYVRIKDKNFKLIDTAKTQKMIVEQDYTKVQIRVVDIDNKELVLGSTITLQDKDGNEITEDWISTKEEKVLTRIPVGEYYIVEKEAPTLRGYVKVEKVEIKVEETSDIQEYELEQDYTKLSLTLVDKETKEEIKEADLIIKDEKGNKVAEISLKEDKTEENDTTKEDDTVKDKQNDKEEQQENTAITEQKIKQVLTRLPVGKYIVESISMQYGYKPIKAQIEVKDTREIQIKELEVEREIFDIQVEEWIEEIVRNGKQEYKNEKEEQTVKKLDVKDKRIPTEDIKITYKIRVKNIGKITGQVGKIEVSIPMGMEFIKEANKGYWEEENGKIITTGLAGKELKEGAYADLEIILRWKNGLENFGTKSNTVRILELTSDIGFKEANEENNVARASDVIIGVSTGEMNILWACWVLLIFLILVEVYVTKKLHIKNFKIKDKTLKYRNKK